MTCKDCNTELDSLNSVYKKGYRLHSCQDCVNKKAREKRANPNDYTQTAEFKLKRKAWNLSRRGSTLEQYNELFALQLGGCAICKKTFNNNVHTDHNHETNEVRGLLCSNCNIALGLLKEDEDIIWNMLEYLKRHDKRIAV